jgi:hypothetical protein
MNRSPCLTRQKTKPDNPLFSNGKRTAQSRTFKDAPPSASSPTVRLQEIDELRIVPGHPVPHDEPPGPRRSFRVRMRHPQHKALPEILELRDVRRQLYVQNVPAYLLAERYAPASNKQSA